jgi:hypothetical protein
MQQEFTFINKATSVAVYEPQNVSHEGDKIWFGYRNHSGSVVSAFYDTLERKFKSVVMGDQYGKDKVAIRNLVARPVIEKLLGNV